MRLDRKPVTDTRHGEDQSRLLGFRLDLPPQSANKNVNAAIVWFRPPASNRFEQKIAAERPPRAVNESPQQLILGASQGNLSTAAVD